MHAIGKRNNRGAQKTEVDGIIFDSKFEAARFSVLKQCLNRGVITELEIQVRLPLNVNGQKVCDYIADFVYINSDGRRIVEDTKGFRDATYRLKAKLFNACYGYPIWESDNKEGFKRNPLLNIANLVALNDAFPKEHLPKSILKKIEAIDKLKASID